MNNNKIKNYLILILAINLLCLPVIALDIDPSIDDEIRKNYNPNKSEEDMGLPSLPKVLNESSSNIKPVVNQQQMSSASLQKVNCSKPALRKASLYKEQNFAILKQGTKIKVKLLNNVSDKTKRGTAVSFISLYPVTTTYFTIPMGTVFKGEVFNSHKPQLAGNGGLIVIKVNSVILNNQVKSIDACVTRANSRMIFFNNIKGKRKYLKSVVKSMKPGKHFFGKMMRVTAELASQGSAAILTPFSVAAGVIALGGNVIAAPVVGLMYKGGSISISEGSCFEIKLLQDVFIAN